MNSLIAVLGFLASIPHYCPLITFLLFIYISRKYGYLQKIWMFLTRLVQVAILFKGPETEKCIKSSLVIAAHASKKVFAGYLANLRDETLDYYIIKKEHFPLPIRDCKDTNEIQMKNLQFALALWATEIQSHSTFRVYTSGGALSQANDKYGKDAKVLLSHLVDCLSAKKVNEKEHLRYLRNWWSYAKYVQPAVDFSQWNADQAVTMLCSMYGIEQENVKGNVVHKHQSNPNSGEMYVPGDNYEDVIQMVIFFAKKFDCKQCSVEAFKNLEQPRNQISLGDSDEDGGAVNFVTKYVVKGFLICVACNFIVSTWNNVVIFIM